jgi:hypothetical protein
MSGIVDDTRRARLMSGVVFVTSAVLKGSLPMAAGRFAQLHRATILERHTCPPAHTCPTNKLGMYGAIGHLCGHRSVSNWRQHRGGLKHASAVRKRCSSLVHAFFWFGQPRRQGRARDTSMRLLRPLRRRSCQRSKTGQGHRRIGGQGLSLSPGQKKFHGARPQPQRALFRSGAAGVRFQSLRS